MSDVRNAIAILAALLVLAPAALLAPEAGARHVCQPFEPPWSCEHRRPTPEDVVKHVCSFLRDCPVAPLA